MAYMDSFRKQHQEILLAARDLSERLKPGEDPKVLRKLLSTLAGKLNFHLAMEDKGLYPRLIETKTGNAGAVARKFKAEMGGLSQVFAAYNDKWQVSAITTDLPGFSKETQAVFGALAERIERENQELYPLADQAH